MFLEEIRCALQRTIALLARLLCVWLLLCAFAPRSGARDALERLLAPTAPRRPPRLTPVPAIPPHLLDVQRSPTGQRLFGPLEDPSCDADHDRWLPGR